MDYLTIILIISLLIFIHELGHFIFARLMKIKIAIFSIGFGPGIIKHKGRKTEYRISLIPIGGYVIPKIQDETEFYKIPVYKRIVFSLGGPAANIILPAMVLILMNIFNSDLSFTAIIIKSVSQILNYLYGIIYSILHIFDSRQLSGIVGIIAAGADLIDSRIQNAIQIFVLLSLNLAIFNMLPIPALDGGKIFLYLLEKIHPKLLKIQIPATIAGWVVILGLMVYATVNDIVRLIT